jgi:BirA family biotin operon repressor/biotin-[acetyl-CoA-carboxylase] ligase
VAQSYRSLVLDRVGSTNTEAFALAQAGEPGPLWVAARRQTAGRGRSCRQWVSEPGNLYASLLTRLDCPRGALAQLSLVAGVAAFDAIRQATGGGVAGLRLKWPNDVLIGQAKCAGLLVECSSGERSVTAVIGIGINLASHPDDLGRPATHLAEHRCDVPPDAMLAFLAGATERWLAAWDGGRGFPAVRAAWLERAGAVGERCSVDTGRERIEGTFADLDAEGALVIRDGHGQRRTVTFGDVTLVAAAPREAGC